MYVLHREDDTKERQYSVISMRVREDVKDSRNADAKSIEAKNNP